MGFRREGSIYMYIHVYVRIYTYTHVFLRIYTHTYIYIRYPPPVPHLHSHFFAVRCCSKLKNEKTQKNHKTNEKQKTNQKKQKNKKPKFLRTSLSLSLCCQKPKTPSQKKNKKTKKNKNKQNKQKKTKKQKNKKTIFFQNYVRYDHILVPSFLFFFVFLFLFFLVFWFSGFDILVEDALVDTNSPCFWQTPRAFSVIFGNVPKQSESSKIFGNRICRSPRRGLIRNQFVSSSCYGLHTNTFN